MSKLASYTPSIAAPAAAPAINKEAALAKYNELCALRDAVNADVAELLGVREVAANAAEVHRVKAMEVSAKITEMRGGLDKWRALKKEIGILARVTTGTIPPSARDLELAAQILGGN